MPDYWLYQTRCDGELLLISSNLLSASRVKRLLLLNQTLLPTPPKAPQEVVVLLLAEMTLCNHVPSHFINQEMHRSAGAQMAISVPVLDLKASFSCRVPSPCNFMMNRTILACSG